MSPPAVYHCTAWHCLALFGMLQWTIWQIILHTLLCLCRSVKWHCLVFETFAAVFAVPKQFQSLFLYLSCHFWRQDKLQRSVAKLSHTFAWIFHVLSSLHLRVMGQWGFSHTLYLSFSLQRQNLQLTFFTQNVQFFQQNIQFLCPIWKFSTRTADVLVTNIMYGFCMFRIHVETKQYTKS